MRISLPVFLVSLTGFTISPLSGAPTADQEFIKNLTLAEYTCEFSRFTSVPMLFVNYKIKNSNGVTFYELALKYKVEYQDVSGSVTSKDGEVTVPQVLMNWTKEDRMQVVTLPGEKAKYKVSGCKAWISGFYKEVPVAKKRTVTVRTGDKINVASDCRNDYAKLQTMAPGVEKREFAAKLVRLGCVSSEAVYGKKTETYHDVEWLWVEYNQ
jgi:hypothetical protein